MVAKLKLPVNERFWVNRQEAAGLLNESPDTFDEQDRYSNMFIELGVEIRPNTFSRQRLLEYSMLKQFD